VTSANRVNRLYLVRHGGQFSFTFKDLCPRIDLDWLRGTGYPNCAITEITVICYDGRLEGELVTWASYAHLSGLAANLVPGSPR